MKAGQCIEFSLTHLLHSSFPLPSEPAPSRRLVFAATILHPAGGRSSGEKHIPTCVVFFFFFPSVSPYYRGWDFGAARRGASRRGTLAALTRTGKARASSRRPQEKGLLN